MSDRPIISQSAIDEIKALEEADKPHWRLFFSTQDNQPCVVCMQSFDYYDVDERRFIDETRYTTEEAAELALEQFLAGGPIIVFKNSTEEAREFCSELLARMDCVPFNVRPQADGSVSFRIHDTRPRTFTG